MIFLDSMSSLTLPTAIGCLAGIILAIMEPKRAQAKPSREQALLRCLIDAVSDLIFIEDRDGVYRGCNKASEAYIGMPESGQIGKTGFDFFDREKAGQIWKADRQVFEQGKPLRIEEGVTCRAGRRLLMDTLHNDYAALVYRKGMPKGHAEVVRELVGPVRGAKIKAILGIGNKPTDYTQKDVEAISLLADLIEDLLMFSRVGRNQMARNPFDLAELTREVIHELEPATGNRNIDWDIGDLPVVTADRAMLRMVLVNLVSNALKFTRPRQQARIEIGSTPGQASEAVIFVRDNGVGFDMAYKDKLFGVFQRLHRVEEFEGTGIGLASVRRIVARHGGRTWARGEPDQGTVFFFSLPQTQTGSGHAHR